MAMAYAHNVIIVIYYGDDDDDDYCVIFDMSGK